MTDTLLAGAAVVDITPPPGLMMCGYAARTEPAFGTHDPLTARAVAIGDTALVVADVLAFHEDSAARIRARSGLADDHVVVLATHTHGGPLPMAGRGGGDADPEFLARLEDGCVTALRAAMASRRPARLAAGNGDNPGIAFNRRMEGGPIDPTVPVLRIDGLDGDPIAVIFAHALHPVVLGAGNRLYTADFVGYARDAEEAALPGSTAIFLPGCSGNISTGHSAASSISTETPADRTFAEAERLGTRLAASVLAARLTPLGTAVAARSALIALDLVQHEVDLNVLKQDWLARAETADIAWATLYRHWALWSDTVAREPTRAWHGRVTAFDWGGLPLCFMPGEIFAETAARVREALPPTPTPFVLSLADGVPGYIPAADAYGDGGYEVTEAHRYYGLPGAFAAGSAERLADAVATLGRRDRTDGAATG